MTLQNLNHMFKHIIIHPKLCVNMIFEKFFAQSFTVCIIHY